MVTPDTLSGYWHWCDLPAGSPDLSPGQAVEYCYGEEEDGSLWVSNGEYTTRVRFCPFCGQADKPAGIAPARLNRGEACNQDRIEAIGDELAAALEEHWDLLEQNEQTKHTLALEEITEARRRAGDALWKWRTRAWDVTGG